MTIVSTDPSWWPTIAWDRSYSYFPIASSTMVMYDWALSFGQEVDLIWRQHWSLMALLYLGVRYMGILYSAIMIVWNLPVVRLTDMVTASSFAALSLLVLINNCVLSGTIVFRAQTWASVVANIMLCIIIIARLYAMYQQSKKMLNFLIIIFLALTIASIVILAIVSGRSSGEESIMSGTYQCVVWGYDPFLTSVTWMLGTAWEVLAVCLSAWIAMKHLRELRGRPIGSTRGGYWAVLIKSHMIYFAGFAVLACFTLAYTLSPTLSDSLFFNGVLQIALFMQLFVLGPRIMLSVREYHHAELVLTSDTGIAMTTIAFQEQTRVNQW